MPKSHAVPADVTQWSEKSKRSVAALFKREYTDTPYECRACGKSSVFTAEDQKLNCEVKKLSIDQRRVLCQECWVESNRIQSALKEKERQWAQSKQVLRHNKPFLNEWLALLVRLELFVWCKPDTAKKNMLLKLLLQ